MTLTVVKTTALTGTITNAQLAGGIDLTAKVTGTLPIGNGGTNSTATTFVNATTNVTGALPIVNGGTGATSFSPGKVNQVISATRRGEYNISGNHGSGFVAMEYPQIIITPSAASSKIKLTWQVLLSADGTGYKTTDLDIQRAISGGTTTSRLAYTADNNAIQGVAGRTFSGSSAVCQTPTTLYTLMWVDSPNTTSAITYKLMSQATDNGANGNLYIFNNGQMCTYVGEEILA